MSDLIPPPKPTLEQTILSIFSIEQAERLLLRIAKVQAQGYGRVTIVFTNGHPDIIEHTETEKFSKSTSYKPE